ncbi:unnamed protein product [Euphydryas editha]|uniref:BED-type domain-containing protein n=1 Tax=Euphydryas editha TaxID=104508 RepID=A0AAU9UYG3_EUPED|nr:unnamed protein product [Euphydryas editha]
MENGPKKAKCSYCSSELSVPGGNVGNLNRHLRTKHPTIKLVEDRQQPIGSVDPEPHIHSVASVETQDPPRATSSSQLSIKNYTRSTKPLPPRRRAEQINEQLIKMFAKGHYPFRMVEDVELKKLISLLNPQYALPTRKTISESTLQNFITSAWKRLKVKCRKRDKLSA